MKILKSLLIICVGLLICDTNASKHRKKSHQTEKVEHMSAHHKSRVHEGNSKDSEKIEHKKRKKGRHKARQEEKFQSDKSDLFGAYNKSLEKKAVEQAESTDGDYTE